MLWIITFCSCFTIALSGTIMLLEDNIGDKNYEQCANSCEAAGGRLATKQEILNYLEGALGNDIWTPVSNSDNEWLQIGGGIHQYGTLHSELGNKPSWGGLVEEKTYKQAYYCANADLAVSTIGSKNYEQCENECQKVGRRLATKQEILNHLTSALGGDIWTPVSNSDNEWLQIGGGIHPYGTLHSELGNKPSWGDLVEEKTYKQTYYCAVKEFTQFDIGTKNYEQCENSCEAEGRRLATKHELLDHLTGALGGDIWTPVLDSDNEWLQIGGGIHPYGTLHSDLGSKPSWGDLVEETTYKQAYYCTVITKELTQFDIGAKNYEQCDNQCEAVGRRLATQQEILNYLTGALGGDIWTPVSDSHNEWLQIGGGIHSYGILHSELGNQPSWGDLVEEKTYKQTYYCALKELTQFDIGAKNYEQCENSCEAVGKHLATKQEILNYLEGALGGDIWTPVSDSDNEWLQIGGGIHQYGILHSELGNQPSWGGLVEEKTYKETYYCTEADELSSSPSTGIIDYLNLGSVNIRFIAWFIACFVLLLCGTILCVYNIQSFGIKTKKHYANS